MNILVTGAKGFIGRNLVIELKNCGYTNIFEVDRDTDVQIFETYCEQADFVFHLAGVNRPMDISEFREGNYGFTSTLLETLRKYQNTCPVMMSSSIQARLSNPYGESKKAGEDILFDYAKETGAEVKIYRFPNVFGKWCRPNYNSAIATFCYNISRDLPITVNDPKVELELVYIDDVVEELIYALTEGTKNGQFYEVPVKHKELLGTIVHLIQTFKRSRDERLVPDLGNPFVKKLYSTYLSYLPEDQFAYPLKMNIDERGSFTEFIKTPDRGQVSINISKPGITKGNHWHHTKNEKFLVVSGEGVIRFRKIDTDDVIEYFVDGNKLEVIDIPVGYTHNIENLGTTDMVTVMWANELFDPEHPDTYFVEV
ncbi:capsular polysaccharide biosynthesis protein CapF [Pradoshia sp. D12]|uniref:capsular polysaccharide biosynthesis protein CapF n=1 Tax=Bacillaceae TaxID=186817 RepID=UPI0011295D70|nr:MULTISPECIES: capsular polysaccharide biosynthesis protein CapF [Bacillaceae]QFK73372.1 capsular polysaccharide biosynthesis protein CapF [Pradoshia sp. D12]TPF72171.1 capsular polysaccharide biosynthesis protein CapF [Bacillus sp. D12]